ncbi:MAG: hypothetical protein GOV00_00715 [Candidatus Altiarchaeota archaeon]|nr:hypothetical protein [Candidatus Altiarchaeota archaeon]
MHLLGRFNYDVSVSDATYFSTKLGFHAKEPFAVGCDSRAGSLPFKFAATSGLLSSGSNVADLGVVPSPVVAKTARDENIWGLHVSADPYPSNYVGIKTYNPSGRAWEGDLTVNGHNGVQVGGLSTIDMVPNYISQILDRHDIEPMKIVVDCANGPLGSMVPAILRAKGCNVIELNSSLSPSPIREYEPTLSNVKNMGYFVSRTGADLGVAFDGAGNKLSFIAGHHFVSSSRALALLMKFNGFRRAVVDIGASSVLDAVGYVDRVPASEATISRVLEERGFSVGGGTMGVIFSEWSFAPDAVFLMMEILGLISERGVKLKELNEAIPAYYEDAVMLKAENPEQDVDSAKAFLNDYELDLRDGVKAFLDQGWVWLKPMKGFVRIAAEAENRHKVKEYLQLGRKSMGLA